MKCVYRIRRDTFNAWQCDGKPLFNRKKPPSRWMCELIDSGRILLLPEDRLAIEGWSENIGVEPGDWIVMSPSGMLSVMSDKEFRKHFKPVRKAKAR